MAYGKILTGLLDHFLDNFFFKIFLDQLLDHFLDNFFLKIFLDQLLDHLYRTILLGGGGGRPLVLREW